MDQAVPCGAFQASAIPRITTFGTILAIHAAIIAAMLSFHDEARVAAIAVPMTVRMVEIPPATPAPTIPPPSPATRRAPAPVSPRHVAQAALPRAMSPTAPLLTAAANAAAASTTTIAAAPTVAGQRQEEAVATPVSELRHEAETAVRFDADYLHNPAPVYPAASRRAGEEGRVLLLVHVSPQGGADSVQVRQGSGFTRLDEAALAAVRQWRFIPARRGGDPIAASVLVPITFRLGR